MRTSWFLCAALLGLALGCSGDGGEDSATGGTDTGGEACYADAQAMKPAPGMSIQNTWGAPCETNADCEALIGVGALCDGTAVVYELPGRYCTKPCTIGPDPMNANAGSFEANDTECDPMGGVDCVGANTIYTRCAVPCTDDTQCTREGYFCRRMPTISGPSDPTYCLMDDCCDTTCAP